MTELLDDVEGQNNDEESSAIDLERFSAVEMGIQEKTCK